MAYKPSNYSENWTITTLNFAFKEYPLTLKAQKCLHCLTCNCSNALAIRCTFEAVRWNLLRSHIVLQFKKNWIRHNSVCDVMSIRTQRKKRNNAGDWRQGCRKYVFSCWLKIQWCQHNSIGIIVYLPCQNEDMDRSIECFIISWDFESFPQVPNGLHFQMETKTAKNFNMTK